jgi:hypothetical protein
MIVLERLEGARCGSRATLVSNGVLLYDRRERSTTLISSKPSPCKNCQMRCTTRNTRGTHGTRHTGERVLRRVGRRQPSSCPRPPTPRRRCATLRPRGPLLWRLEPVQKPTTSFWVASALREWRTLGRERGRPSPFVLPLRRACAVCVVCRVPCVVARVPCVVFRNEVSVGKNEMGTRGAHPLVAPGTAIHRPGV